MEVFVCFQVVPDLSGAGEDAWPAAPEDAPQGRFRRVFDAYDESALEQGLRLRGADEEVHLTAVTVSPVDDRRYYETLLALGYERVIRLDAATKPFASRSRAVLLADAVRGADLILTGRQSGLSGSRSVPRLLAQQLDLPYMDGVYRLERTAEGVAFASHSDGMERCGVLASPAVVMIGDGGWLRVPTLKARAAVSGRTAEVLSPPLPVPEEEQPLRLSRPAPHSPCRVLEGSTQQQAQELLSLLSEKREESGGGEKDPCSRPAYGGAMTACYASQRPVLPAYSAPGAWLLQFAETAEEAGKGLAEAELVIAAGRGCSAAADRERLERLAAMLGGELGATRAAALNGWYPLGALIGVSGAQLSASTVLTVGASGAAAFTAGLERCARVIAVDKDPRAPIFRRADIGIISPCGAILQALEETLIQKRAQ